MSVEHPCSYGASISSISYPSPLFTHEVNLCTYFGHLDHPSNTIVLLDRPFNQSIRTIICSINPLINKQFGQSFNGSFNPQYHRSFLKLSWRPSALHPSLIYLVFTLQLGLVVQIPCDGIDMYTIQNK